MFLIQNALYDQEMKKDLKMQDLKTFDEIKSRIIKCAEVKKEIEIECVSTINKAKVTQEQLNSKKANISSKKDHRKNSDIDHIKMTERNKDGN